MKRIIFLVLLLMFTLFCKPVTTHRIDAAKTQVVQTEIMKEILIQEKAQTKALERIAVVLEGER